VIFIKSLVIDDKLVRKKSKQKDEKREEKLLSLYRCYKKRLIKE